MASYFLIIPIYGAALVHCAEVQNQPPALRQMKVFNSSSVPESLAGLQDAVYSRAPRLGRKGHQDPAVRRQFCIIFKYRFCAESIFPPAVQTGPVRAPHLRSGIFRQRHGPGSVVCLLAPHSAQLSDLSFFLPAKLQGCDRVFQSHNSQTTTFDLNLHFNFSLFL